MAFAGGVRSTIHSPSSETATPAQRPRPSVAVVPGLNACAGENGSDRACVAAARSTMVVEPVSVIANAEAVVSPLTLATVTGSVVFPNQACTAARTAVMLRAAWVTSLLPVSRRSCGVPLKDSPRRGDRSNPKSVTRMASCHRGHSVEVTEMGSVPTASVGARVPREASDVTRHTSSPSPPAEPKYAPTLFTMPNATGAFKLGSQRIGPSAMGAKEEEERDWYSAMLGALPLVKLALGMSDTASGPAGDTVHDRLAVIMSNGHRLSKRRTGVGTSESEITREPACADSCAGVVAEKIRAYGAREIEVLGRRVCCVVVCDTLKVSVDDTVVEGVAAADGDCEAVEVAAALVPCIVLADGIAALLLDKITLALCDTEALEVCDSVDVELEGVCVGDVDRDEDPLRDEDSEVLGECEGGIVEIAVGETDAVDAPVRVIDAVDDTVGVKVCDAVFDCVRVTDEVALAVPRPVCDMDGAATEGRGVVIARIGKRAIHASCQTTLRVGTVFSKRHPRAHFSRSLRVPRTL